MARSIQTLGGLAIAIAAGAPTEAAQAVLYKFTSNATEFAVGQRAVVRLDDVDQDGTSDFGFLLVTVPQKDTIRVASGATGAPLYTIVTTSTSNGANPG